jgi:transposase
MPHLLGRSAPVGRSLPQSAAEDDRVRRHALSDREWAQLWPHLPPRRPGTRDHRTIIDALLWLAKTGAPWRDLPERFGPWRTVATRFYRWTRSGLWGRLLAGLRRVVDAQGGIDWEVHMVDGTKVRAHRHAAAVGGGQHRQALGRSRGGFGSKLHLRSDRWGRPMAFVLTPRGAERAGGAARADGSGRGEAAGPRSSQAAPEDRRG